MVVDRHVPPPQKKRKPYDSNTCRINHVTGKEHSDAPLVVYKEAFRRVRLL